MAADAVSGKRDVALPGAVLQSAFAVYDRVDYIKVTPETSMARLGGDVHPKGYQQLEAVGYQRGADGKPHTADDVELGPDGSDLVGGRVLRGLRRRRQGVCRHPRTRNGLFTPALDGPNPQRKFRRNNYGDVWAVATAKNEKDKDGKPLVGQIVPGRGRSDVHSVGSAGGDQVTPTVTRTFRLGEFHEFDAGDSRFVYLVPAGAIFELDDAAAIGAGPSGRRASSRSRNWCERLGALGLSAADAVGLLGELTQSARHRHGRCAGRAAAKSAGRVSRCKRWC